MILVRQLVNMLKDEISLLSDEELWELKRQCHNLSSSHGSLSHFRNSLWQLADREQRIRKTMEKQLN